MSQFHCLNKVQPESVTALGLPPNTSCVLLKKQTISVEPTPMPILQPDGVLVKVIATGICGSDLHNYLAGGVGGRPVTQPLVMGHESAGEVIAVGDMVTTHKVGDRVAVEPGLPCRRCTNCKSGRINICLNASYCGAPGSVGSLMKFFALPADMAPHLPENVSWEVAGSLQPLAVGVQIGIRADLRAHQTVAIMGCGPIGLIAGAVAHAYSASKIIGFDINPKRVEFARTYLSPTTGKPIFDAVFLVTDLPRTTAAALADAVAENEQIAHATGVSGSNGDARRVPPPLVGAPAPDAHVHRVPPQPEEETPEGDIKFDAAKVRARRYLAQAGIEPEGVDRVVEASGAEDAGMLGIAIAKQGATYLAVGLGHHQTNVFPTLAVTNKEIDVKGITRYTSTCFPSAIDLLRRGVVDLKPLITKVFPLSQSKNAFDAVASGEEIKVIIANQDAP